MIQFYLLSCLLLVFFVITGGPDLYVRLVWIYILDGLIVNLNLSC